LVRFCFPGTGSRAAIARLVIPQLAVSRLLAALLALVLAAAFATAPPARASDVQLWTDLTTLYRFDGRWRYDGDLGLRGDLSNDTWTVAYIRPSVRYQVRPWLRLHGGFGLFYAWLAPRSDLFELRPWLGVNVTWPRLGDFTISHYVRLEQRNVGAVGGGEWANDLRGRYRLQVTSPETRFLHRTYFLASAEYFTDVEGAFADVIAIQNRFLLGAGDRLSDRWRVELHYIRQNSQLARTATFDVQEHVVRLRFFVDLN
jgi:hypothetical protein